MKIQQLLEEYRQAAIRHDIATEQSKPRLANKAAHQVHQIFEQFRTGSPEMQHAFLALLQDENTSVRCWAARDSLAFAPDEAVRALREIAAGPRSNARFNAELILDEWEAGRFKP